VAAAKIAALIPAAAQPRYRTRTTSVAMSIGASHSAPPPLRIAMTAALTNASGISGRAQNHSRIAPAARPAIDTISAPAATSLIPPHR
jgi:hypothetical protein